jgi:hypothetical protein
MAQCHKQHDKVIICFSISKPVTYHCIPTRPVSSAMARTSKKRARESSPLSEGPRVRIKLEAFEERYDTAAKSNKEGALYTAPHSSGGLQLEYKYFFVFVVKQPILCL